MAPVIVCTVAIGTSILSIVLFVIVLKIIHDSEVEKKFFQEAVDKQMTAIQVLKDVKEDLTAFKKNSFGIIEVDLIEKMLDDSLKEHNLKIW